MPFLPNLPETAHLSDLFALFPRGITPLMAYTDAILREDGELTVAQREMIATFVSGLNACTFCYGSHKIYAEVFGIDGDIIDAIIADIDSADIDDKIKPILHYVKKLNTLPSKIVQKDAQAVFDAGWGEAALFEAVQVCGLFNMMNRIIEGAGVNFDYALTPERHSVRQNNTENPEHSYAGFGKTVGK